MTAKKKWKAPAGFTLTRHEGYQATSPTNITANAYILKVLN